MQNGSAGQHALAAGPSWDMNPHKSAATAAAVDRYNTSNRQKSLLEQHQEKKSKKRKAATVAGADNKQKQVQKDQKEQKDTWEGKHPWRPFDREKDLNIGAKPVSQADLLKKAGSLTGRFGGPVGRRTFL